MEQGRADDVAQASGGNVRQQAPERRQEDAGGVQQPAGGQQGKGGRCGSAEVRSCGC